MKLRKSCALNYEEIMERRRIASREIKEIAEGKRQGARAEIVRDHRHGIVSYRLIGNSIDS